MKKIIYIASLMLLVLFAHISYAQASFFDDLWNMIKGGKISIDTTTSTTTTTAKNVQEIPNNVLCFRSHLTVGNENQDVWNLQQFLYEKGFYKEGLITGYFGPLTKKAVINFQNYYYEDVLKPLGLRYATGYVGNSSLNKLNILTGCSVYNNESNNNIFLPDFENINLDKNDNVKKLPDLVISNFSPKNWNELLSFDKEAWKCRTENKCTSYASGYNKAWVTEKNIGSLKSGKHIIALYIKRSESLFGKDSDYYPMDIIMADELSAGEEKTYEINLPLLTFCYDSNKFDDYRVVKAVIYNQSGLNSIKTINDNAEKADKNEIYLGLVEAYAKSGIKKLLPFEDTSLYKKMESFKNNSSISDYVAFEELNVLNNNYLLDFKCGAKTKNTDNYGNITQIYRVAQEPWTGGAKCIKGEGEFSLEECLNIGHSNYLFNMFLSKGAEPFPPNQTYYYCNQLTGKCVDIRYTLKNKSGGVCGYYKGPYKYYSAEGGGINNDCIKECSRDLSFFKNYQVNFNDLFSCHPVFYNNFSITNKSTSTSGVITTTTDAPEPIVRTGDICYRCSHSHYEGQQCVAVTSGCDSNDYYSVEDCIKNTPCVKGYPLRRGAPPFYTCDLKTKQCIGSLQQGPTFMSYTDCKESCSTDFDVLVNKNEALPDLVTRVITVKTSESSQAHFSTITAKVKNIGTKTAVCRLQNGQKAPFRYCISGVTLSRMPCKDGMEWDDLAGCCKVNRGDLECLDESYIYEKDSLYSKISGVEKKDANGTIWKVEDNDSSELKPNEEIVITYRAKCIEELVDAYIVADHGNFETNDDAVRLNHAGNYLKYNYLSTSDKWKYGTIKESNELNNSAYIDIGCTFPRKSISGGCRVQINDITNTY